MGSRISFLIFVFLLSFPLLLLLHHSLLAAQCQYNLVETLALLPPRLEIEQWSNGSSCRSITFHQGQEVFMTDLLKDCVAKLDLKKGEMEVMGTECEEMNREDGLLMDQMGGVMVELEEEDKIALYSGDVLLICSQ